MVWLCCLAASLSFGGSQGEASMLQKIVPVVTGKNGYEDYLMAVDKVDGRLLGVYEQWISYKRVKLTVPQKGEEPDAEVPEMPADVTPDMSILAVRKAENERFGFAFDQVIAGNGKRVWDPRETQSFNTLFPEFAKFKVLARIGSNRAHVAFSEGRTLGAVKDLLEVIDFSRNMSQKTLISMLVGIAVQAIALAEFNEHLGQLPLGDCQYIAKQAKSLLEHPLSTGSVFQGEATLSLSSLDDILKEPGAFLTEDEDKSYVKAIQNLSSADRDRLKAQLINSVQLRLQATEALLDGPEDKWLLTMAGDPAPSIGDGSVGNLCLVLANSLAGSDSKRGYVTAMAKGRIQLRLLYLHAKVLEYHWKTGVWPTTLAQAAGAEFARDPFAQAPFHYEVNGNTYRLYSTGITGAGPIELKYVRPHTNVDENPDKP